MMQSLEKYISDYLGDTPFTYDETFDMEISGISIHIEALVYDGEPWCKAKALVTMVKDDLSYEFTAVDRHNWENAFWHVTVHATPHLCFRKSLYGFTRLNTETFEDFDFFPKKVINGEESYIIVEAMSFGDYIVFDGCYWGSPYVFYIYDHQNRCFLDLYESFGLYASGDEPGASIHQDILSLKCNDQSYDPVTLKLSYKDLTNLLNAKGKPLATDF